MPPNCQNISASTSSSIRFKPSLACIAEEEPTLIAIRSITVSEEVCSSSKPFKLKIPIYDVNIYLPVPPKPPLPESYQRLLGEMDKFIETQYNSEKYKEMAKRLRLKIAIEQAEAARLKKSNFTNRDWFWYSEQTKRFVDESVNAEKIHDEVSEMKLSENVPISTTAETDQDDGNVFNLDADF